jgi:hypothetical protein
VTWGDVSRTGSAKDLGTVALNHREVILESATGRDASLVTPLALVRWLRRAPYMNRVGREDHARSVNATVPSYSTSNPTQACEQINLLSASSTWAGCLHPPSTTSPSSTRASSNTRTSHQALTSTATHSAHGPSTLEGETAHHRQVRIGAVQRHRYRVLERVVARSRTEPEWVVRSAGARNIGALDRAHPTVAWSVESGSRCRGTSGLPGRERHLATIVSDQGNLSCRRPLVPGVGGDHRCG